MSQCNCDNEIRRKLADNYRAKIEDVTCPNMELITGRYFVEYEIKGKKKPLLMMFQYCPICGRKLEPEEEKPCRNT